MKNRENWKGVERTEDDDVEHFVDMYLLESGYHCNRIDGGDKSPEKKPVERGHADVGEWKGPGRAAEPEREPDRDAVEHGS